MVVIHGHLGDSMEKLGKFRNGEIDFPLIAIEAVPRSIVTPVELGDCALRAVVEELSKKWSENHTERILSGLEMFEE